MLKKAFRLPANASLKNAKSLHTNYLFIKYAKNNLESSRYGFVVSKRISKNAVVRNRIKRRFRAVIEDSINILPVGYDMLLIVKRLLKEKEKIDSVELTKLITQKII